jgi:hypothetical protein
MLRALSCAEGPAGVGAAAAAVGAALAAGVCVSFGAGLEPTVRVSLVRRVGAGLAL